MSGTVFTNRKQKGTGHGIGMHKHASGSCLAFGYYANFHAVWRPDPVEETTVPGKVKRKARHVKNRKNKRK